MLKENKMFNEENCMDYILNCFPNFKARISDYHEGFKDKNWIKPTLCGELMELSNYVTELYENQKRHEETLKKIFNVVEEVASQADENLKGALEVCFFESVINYLGNSNLLTDDFRHLLGPVSLEVCKSNDQFWGTKTKGLYNETE
jgi:hypothetical protein